MKNKKKITDYIDDILCLAGMLAFAVDGFICSPEIGLAVIGSECIIAALICAKGGKR